MDAPLPVEQPASRERVELAGQAFVNAYKDHLEKRRKARAAKGGK